MARSRRFAATVLTLALAAGCVERTMQINTNPPGAVVWANDQEIGRAPIERDFLWYGTYDVQVRADGYETLDARTKVIAPWWQWPPIDLVVDLLPWRFADHRKISYTLRPASTQPADAGEMLARALEMRGQLESSEFTRKASATQPTTSAIQPTSE